MNVVRFSAIRNFGVPIDRPELIGDPDYLVGLMHAYDIEEEPIAREATDITPIYWRNPAFKYFVSGREDGSARVEMQPRHNDSQAILLGGGLAVESSIRAYEVPSQIAGIPIAGPGPRFSGQICIHELVIDV
jgi:hypothetical protein